MNNLFNIIYCELWKDSNKKARVCYLPSETILVNAEEYRDGFTKVIYQTSNTLVGWVEDSLLNPIHYALPSNVVDLDNETLSLQDLAQFVTIEGNVQFNLCGEVALCSILGIGLSTMLKEWKASPTGWYNKVFQKGHARTTGVPDLRNMLSIFPNFESRDLMTEFGLNGRIVLTAERVRNALQQGYKLVIGVHINHKGYVTSKGVLHWIVVNNVMVNGVNNGWVALYNPATNNIEEKDFKALLESIGSPFGLLVRKIPYSSIL